MSGAEVLLGVVAGGAGLMSLSIQLAESAVKLKKFYHSMRNAPEALNSIADEIQIISMSLKLIAQHWRIEIHAADILNRCIEQCRRHVTNIEQLTGNMSQKLVKAPLSGKFYAALRENDLDKLLDDLDRSRAALQLAVQLYHQEEQTRRWLIHQNDCTKLDEQIIAIQRTLQAHKTDMEVQLSQIVQQTQSHHIQGLEVTLPQLVGSDQLPDPSGTLLKNWNRRSSHNHHPRPVVHRVKFKLPSWFSTRVWEITRVDAQQGWDFCFRVYNQRPWDSPIFECCLINDLDGVKRLIQNGEASLFDVNPAGDNLLSVTGHAFPSYNLDLVQWLVEQNVTLGGDKLCEFLAKSLQQSGSWPQVRENLLQMFIHEIDGLDEEVKPRVFKKLWWACDHLPTLETLSHKFAGYLHGLAAKKRARFVRFILRPGKSATVYMAKIDLCRDLPSLNHFWRANATKVLCHVARAIYKLVQGSLDNLDSALIEWAQIGIAALKHGADPLETRKSEKVSYTPLLAMIAFYSTGIVCDFLAVRLSSATRSLKLWMHMLDAANIDMPAYFLRESSVWSSTNVHVIFPTFKLFDTTIRLIALDYDPISQQCSLRVRHEVVCPVVRLHHLPGSFTSRVEVPSTICWLPSHEELEEGHWARSESDSLVLRGREMDSQELTVNYADTAESYQELLHCTQDDTGTLMRMIDISHKGPRSRKRSSSQPVPLSRRRYDYEYSHSFWMHLWLPPIHFCADRSTWVISDHAYNEPVRAGFVDARRCVKSDGVMSRGLGRSRYTFLGQIRACQTGRRCDLEYMPEDPHDCTPQCLQGCGKVDFTIMPKPQSLPDWHPGFHTGDSEV